MLLFEWYWKIEMKKPISLPIRSTWNVPEVFIQTLPMYSVAKTNKKFIDASIKSYNKYMKRKAVPVFASKIVASFNAFKSVIDVHWIFYRRRLFLFITFSNNSQNWTLSRKPFNSRFCTVSNIEGFHRENGVTGEDQEFWNPKTQWWLGIRENPRGWE